MRMKRGVKFVVNEVGFYPPILLKKYTARLEVRTIPVQLFSDIYVIGVTPLIDSKLEVFRFIVFRYAP